MSQGRVNPNKTLESQGITGLGAAYYNLIEPDLVHAAVCRGEAELGIGGTVLVETGKFTGRSPNDKHYCQIALYRRQYLVGEQSRDVHPRALTSSMKTCSPI